MPAPCMNSTSIIAIPQQRKRGKCRAHREPKPAATVGLHLPLPGERLQSAPCACTKMNDAAAGKRCVDREIDAPAWAHDQRARRVHRHDLPPN